MTDKSEITEDDRQRRSAVMLARVTFFQSLKEASLKFDEQSKDSNIGQVDKFMALGAALADLGFLSVRPENQTTHLSEEQIHRLTAILSHIGNGFSVAASVYMREAEGKST